MEWEHVVAYWGKHLDGFPVMVKSRAAQSGMRIKRNDKDREILLPSEALAGASLAIVKYEGIQSGKYKTQLLWPSSFPRKFSSGDQLWPICILSFLDSFKDVTKVILPHKGIQEDKDEDEGGDDGDNGVFSDIEPLPKVPRTRTAAPEPDFPDHDPCKTGVLYVSEEDARRIDEGSRAAVWAVCAYQACDAPCTAWPIRTSTIK